MIFTQDQILQLLEIIEKNTILYSITTLGREFLSSDDKFLLRKHGIDLDKINIEGWTPAEKAFYFGRLSIALGDEQTKRLRYKDLLSYMEKGQYVPLSNREKYMLDLAKNRTYNHIKGLGEQMKQTVNGIIIEESSKQRSKYENIIRDEIKLGIQQRKSLSDIMLEIGHRTDDWKRNLGRIVHTEYNNIFQEGRAAQYLERYGEDVMVYKQVFPLACRYCVKAYLTNGIGSQPRLFRLGDLIKNGTNIGLKVADWKPVLSSMHPFCRCNLHYIPKGQEWDKEKKEFRYPENNKSDIIWTKKDKITIGDKIFYV